MPKATKLNHRVHDFFQKFKRDRGAIKVDPQAQSDPESGEGGENLPAQSQTGGREVSIAQIKQGYGEVVDTMQSVRRHLDEQAQRSDRMIQLLEGLPEAIKSLPEQNKAQTEMLRAIHQNMERQTETTGQLSTAISSLSTVGENQQKTMNELQDHLRAEDVARRELRDGIGTLDKTLTEVRESSDSSRSALESISEQAKQRDNAIGEMFQRSQKTTSAMMAVSWALAIVALAVSAFVAVRVTQMSGNDAANPTVTAGVNTGVQQTGDATGPDAAVAGTESSAPDAAGDTSTAATPDSPAPIAPSESASAGDATGTDSTSDATGHATGESTAASTAQPADDTATDAQNNATAGDTPAESDTTLAGESRDTAEQDAAEQDTAERDTTSDVAEETGSTSSEEPSALGG